MTLGTLTAVSAPDKTTSLRDMVRAEIPGVLADLKELVAIESVSADPARTAEVERSAEHIVQLLADLRCPDVRVIRAKDGAPAVMGRFPAPEGKPTVCLYAHHDVQPEGEPALWRTPPFVATELEGRLFGRGTADDKGGFAVQARRHPRPSAARAGIHSPCVPHHDHSGYGSRIAAARRPG